MLRAVSLLLVILLLAKAATAQVPTADQMLRELGFSAADKYQVLTGEFVSTSLKPTSDREIAVALAFLVQVPPHQLIEEARQGLLFSVDPDTIGFGRIHGDGSLDDFSGVTLQPDPEARTRLYLDAAPGPLLNLSPKEIAAFRSLGGLRGKPTAPVAVREELRRTLLARHRAYRRAGIDGIADYARAGELATPAAGDLRRASEAAVLVEKYAPAFHAVLLGYPQATAPGFLERFDWTHYESHGAGGARTPLYVLTHRFSMPDGDAYVVGQRHYYVSRSFNVEQAIAAFLPATRGTLVVYVSRRSTDGITGFGGSSKRFIESRAMASQLKSLFGRARAAAEERGGGPE